MHTAEDLLALAVKFRVAEDLYVEKRGAEQWAVTTASGCCVSTDLRSVYEPLPSNRSEEFMEKCRFTLDEALDIAERFAVARDARA